MLLRHTDDKVVERKALTINPAKTCQPIGAMYAALGVTGCLPHSHGSQGCCSYHRSTLTRHFKEPIMSGTSSFTEGSSVFGGQSNLLGAIETMFTVYKPEVIAIHTTCLSETIGDDMAQIVQKAQDDGKIPEGKKVVFCNTPSYVGSHVTGYANMVEGIVKGLATDEAPKNDTVNLIAGWMEPSDIENIKALCAQMKVDTTLLPDVSGVVNAPMIGEHEFYPRGGTSIAEVEAMGSSAATLAMGHFCSKPAAKVLDTKFKVPYKMMDIPIGLSATDRFVTELSKTAGVQVPQSVTDERGKLVDLISDMNQYLYGKRVALWGDPDTLVPLCEFLVDLGMKPVYVVSGHPGKYTEQRLKEILAEDVPEAVVKQGQQADMFYMHQLIKKESVDLLIGNTYGKYIARDEDIPFLRSGFPILDRVGHSYFGTTGYTGGLRLLTQILDKILDRKDRDEPEQSFELVM